MSALLFLVFIEILAIDIKSDESIQGVHLPGLVGLPCTPVKISLLAFDTTIFVANETSLKNAMCIIKNVWLCSRTYFKYNKTKGVFIVVNLM